MTTAVISAVRWYECIPLLAQGAVVAIPTDTVYGIAARPDSYESIDRIYEAKGRPAEKALPMLVSDSSAAERIAQFSPLAGALARAFWPGALTLVVQAAADFKSAALASDGTIGIRMPDSSLSLHILAGAGGVLAVTSANLSGLPAARSTAEVLEQLDGRIDAVVDGGDCAGGVASTVVRVTSSEPSILREGAISSELIWRALRGLAKPDPPDHAPRKALE